MPPLPVGNIRLHTEQTVFRFPYRFVCRHGDNINRHHQIAVEVSQLRHHTVLDIGSVLTQKKDSPVTVAHFEVVLFKFHRIRADIVLEAVSLFAGFLYIKVERGFLPHTVEIVKNTQPFVCFQFHALAAEPSEVGNQVSAHTSKIIPCVLNILLVDGNRYILILHDGICACGFF